MEDETIFELNTLTEYLVWVYCEYIYLFQQIEVSNISHVYYINIFKTGGYLLGQPTSASKRINSHIFTFNPGANVIKSTLKLHKNLKEENK